MVRASLLAIAFCLAPAVADASVVTFRLTGQGSEEFFPNRWSPTSLYSLAIDGEPGEANAFSVTVSDFVYVTDQGTLLRAGSGCEQVDSHRARCRFTGPYLSRVTGFLQLGDGDDSVSPLPLIASFTSGGPGDDRIAGGDGRDVIDGGAGSDTMSGGSGYAASDTVSYESRAEGVTVSMNGQADDGAVGEADSVAADFERLAGGAGDDVLDGLPSAHDNLVGNGGNDLLRGFGGSDWLDGGAGDDRLDAGEDDDHLSGGPGADLLVAGPGDRDTVSYVGAQQGVVIDLDGVADDGAPAERDNVGEDAEFLQGSKHDDLLIGGPGPNFIEGVGGRDRIYGLAGNDNLSGGDEGGLIDPGPGQDSVSTWVRYDVFDAFTAVAAQDGEPDTISCSGLFDLEADALDDTALCEPEPVIRSFEPRVAVDRHTGVGRLWAALEEHHREARGRFVIRGLGRAKTVLGRGRFRLLFRKPKMLRFKLSGRGVRRFKRRLQEAEYLGVRVRFTGRDEADRPLFGEEQYSLYRRPRARR